MSQRHFTFALFLFITLFGLSPVLQPLFAEPTSIPARFKTQSEEVQGYVALVPAPWWNLWSDSSLMIGSAFWEYSWVSDELEKTSEGFNLKYWRRANLSGFQGYHDWQRILRDAEGMLFEKPGSEPRRVKVEEVVFRLRTKDIGVTENGLLILERFAVPEMVTVSYVGTPSGERVCVQLRDLKKLRAIGSEYAANLRSCYENLSMMR